MPKQFIMHTPRGSAPGDNFIHVIEISHWEIFLMLLGREVETITAEGRTMIRNGPAYSAFNLSAPEAANRVRT